MVVRSRNEAVAPAEAFRLHSRFITVRAGAQIVRYLSAQDVRNPPIVMFQAMPDDVGHVDLVASKDHRGCALGSPGDEVIIRASRDVRLVATTASLDWPGAGGAVLKIERIDAPGSGAIARDRGLSTVELIDTHPGPETRREPKPERADRRLTRQEFRRNKQDFTQSESMTIKNDVFLK